MPDGWVSTTLEEAVAPRRVSVAPADNPELSYVGMEHVESESMRLLGTTSAREMKSNALRFRSGDVLYGRLRPYLNKVHRPNFEGLCSAEFIVLPGSSVVDSRYLQYFLNSWPFKSFASHLNAGDRPRVDWDQLKGYSLPLPPLAEQRRIISAIEEQLSRLDAGVAALERARANLKRYRTAVLKAAVEGRLTEAWREENLDAEPASRLLERIVEERREWWEKEQLRANQRKGKEPPKGWRAKYKEPTGTDGDGLPKLPDGWRWVRAEQVCGFITKGTTPPANELRGGSGEVPFIKVYNLTFDGSLNFRVEPTFVDEQTHTCMLNRSRVFPGDVLMNIVGPPLGKVSVVPDLHPEWNMNQAIAVFRAMPSFDRRFLCLSLLSEGVLSWAKRRAKATAGQFNLTLEICRDLPLPCPSLHEQDQIVSEVRRRLSVLEQVEAQVAVGLRRAGNLRQSVLKRAFEGKLVPQDPTDEPASELLGRIRVERARSSRSGAGKQARKEKKAAKEPDSAEIPATLF